MHVTGFGLVTAISESQGLDSRLIGTVDEVLEPVQGVHHRRAERETLVI
jgi:hypothetical protein